MSERAGYLSKKADLLQRRTKDKGCCRPPVMSTPEFLGGTWLYSKHKNHNDHPHTVRLDSGSDQMSQIKDLSIRRSIGPGSSSLCGCQSACQAVSDSECQMEACRPASGLEPERVWLRISLLVRNGREHGYTLSANGEVTAMIL